MLNIFFIFDPMVKIKAKFIGRDSLGFKNGIIYDLDAYISSIVPKVEVTIRNSVSKHQVCRYSEMKFLNINWEILAYQSPIKEDLYIYEDEYKYTLEPIVTRIIRERKLKNILNA
jgi:hypothetical protein